MWLPCQRRTFLKLFSVTVCTVLEYYCLCLHSNGIGACKITLPKLNNN